MVTQLPMTLGNCTTFTIKKWKKYSKESNIGERCSGWNIELFQATVWNPNTHFRFAYICAGEDDACTCTFLTAIFSPELMKSLTKGHLFNRKNHHQSSNSEEFIQSKSKFLSFSSAFGVDTLIKLCTPSKNVIITVQCRVSRSTNSVDSRRITHDKERNRYLSLFSIYLMICRLRFWILTRAQQRRVWFYLEVTQPLSGINKRLRFPVTRLQDRMSWVNLNQTKLKLRYFLMQVWCRQIGENTVLKM